MALSWNYESSESVELDDFVEYFKAQGKEIFDHDLDASALMMRRIANNRAFLTDRLNQELASVQNLKGFQSINQYTPQIFILHSNTVFFVRVNIWEPVKQRPGEGLFYYESPHDHNFSFLTVGYLGTGYHTQIHAYDASQVVGYPDEEVALRYLEDTSLPLGKVMYFRQSIDVHTQLPPKELSISLNVLKRPADPRPDQYFFDLERGRNLGKVDKHPIGLVIRLAGALGDENSIDALSAIMTSHECRRTRLAAFEAVAARQGGAVWEQARDDRDRLVQQIASERLKKLASGA